MNYANLSREKVLNQEFPPIRPPESPESEEFPSNSSESEKSSHFSLPVDMSRENEKKSGTDLTINSTTNAKEHYNMNTTTDASKFSMEKNLKTESIISVPSQPPLFPEHSAVSESSSDDSSKSSHFSLPVVMFTSDFLKMCVDNRLSRVPILLGLSMLGNMDTHRGFIHKFKVSDKAKFLGCSEARIYQSLHVLRKIGFANLKLRHGTVSGRVMVKSMLPGRVMSEYERFKARQDSGELDVDASFENLHGHSMPVGMLHHLQLEAHIAGGTTAGHLRLMLACCLNVDVQTGVLKEKRPCEWSELAGIHRTWIVKGFSHFNEIGVAQTQTDYDVTGHLPFVAMSNGYFRLSEFAREEGRGDSKDRLTEKCVALYEAFGIQLSGLAHEIIENAWRLLGAEADKILRRSREKMKALLGREPSGSFERRRIVEGADRESIPHRDTIGLREAIPFA